MRIVFAEKSGVSSGKRALRLRKENPKIAHSEITIVEELTEDDTAAITKTYEGSTIAIVYNTSDEAVTVDLAGTELAETYLAEMSIRGTLTLQPTEEITLEDAVLSMPARSICVLK